MRFVFFAIALWIGFSSKSEAQIVTAVTSDSVDSRTQFNFGRSIATGGTQIVHQVWVETTTVHNIGAVKGKIMYRISPDGGSTWTSNKALTGVIETGYPKIAVFGPYVYIAYQQLENNTYNIKLLFSKNSGTDWFGTATPSAIVVGPGTTPSLAAFSNYVHIAMSNISSTGYSEIYYRGGYVTSAGSLAFLTTSKMISLNDSHSSWTPDIATEGPNVYVTWTDERHNSTDCALTTSAECFEEIYFRRSHQLGLFWEPEQRLTYSPSKVGHNASSLAAANGVVHVAIHRKPPGQIYYMRLTERGSIPQSELKIADDGKTYSRPSIAVKDSTVQLVFAGIVTGEGMKIFRTKSVDGGLKFDANSAIPNTLAFSQQPNVAIDGNGKTHLSFTANTLDGNPNFQIFYANW